MRHKPLRRWRTHRGEPLLQWCQCTKSLLPLQSLKALFTGGLVQSNLNKTIEKLGGPHWLVPS